MTCRNRIVFLLILSAGPFVARSQDLTENTKVPSRDIPTSTISAAGDSTVKAPAAKSSGKAKKPPLPAASWQREDDKVTGSFNRELLTRLKAVNVQLINYIYDSCLAGPSHHSAWHGEFRSEKGGDSAGLKFGIKCSFPATEGRTNAVPTTLEITANDLSPLIKPISVYDHDYSGMVPVKGARNECSYFEPVFVPEGAMVTAIRMGKTNLPRINTWLVPARPDELPYVAMSRKEFLEEMDSSLKTNKATMIKALKEKNPVRPSAVQEAEKEKTLESFSATYSGTELQMRKRHFLDQYKTDEEDLKGIIDEQTAPTDSTMSFIEGMLHRLSSGTLASPAYVPAKAKEFEGFADGEEDAVLLIRIKKAGGVPTAAEKPRFFLVTFTYDPMDTEATLVKGELTKKLDPTTMKGLMKN